MMAGSKPILFVAGVGLLAFAVEYPLLAAGLFVTIAVPVVGLAAVAVIVAESRRGRVAADQMGEFVEVER